MKKYNEFINNDTITINDLISKVKLECGNKSDLYQIYENINYQKIIKLGKKSIPYILENMSVIWIKALEEITKVKLYEEFSLSTQEMKDIWLKWAKENGY